VRVAVPAVAGLLALLVASAPAHTGVATSGFVYDDAKRVVQSMVADERLRARTTPSAYDALGRLLTLEGPSGERIT
jgi:hypothetical protein